MSYGFHARDLGFEFTEIISAAAWKSGDRKFLPHRHIRANTELCHLLAE